MISLRSDKGTLIALACTAAVVLFLVWVGLHWILGVILFVAFALLILLKEGAAPAPVSPVGFGPGPVPPDDHSMISSTFAGRGLNGMRAWLFLSLWAALVSSHSNSSVRTSSGSAAV
jgi:hypothetical protein